MSNEKQQQILQMAKDICRVKLNCNDVCNPISACDALKYAERAVEAGYSKQSEGGWIDKPTGAYGRMQSWCSACGKHSGIGGIESNRHKPFCPNCGAKMKGGTE